MSSHRTVRPRTPDSVRASLRRGARFRQWRARTGDLLEAAAVISLVAIVVEYLAGGGSHDIVSGAASTSLIAVSRLTGLVAMDLLLIELLLAARIPWVDRVYGMDRALVAHRVLGRITVPLVLVHVSTLVAGFVMRDHLGPVTGPVIESLRLATSGSDLLFASVATLLLCVVATTSVSIARRRLSYEWWHVVHLTAYAAVVLSIPHQLSLGSDFTRSAWVHDWWITLYVVVAASVLWWRFVVPLLRSLRHGLRVTRVVPEGPDVWSVWVRGRHLARLPVRAGQYFGWRFVTPRLLLSAHPWSVSTAPDGRHLRITVRDLGDHSSALRNLRPGTPVLIEGPYGAFTTEGRTRSRVLLLAAGIGVTPIRALLEELVEGGQVRPGDITVVYRANDASQLTLREELERLVAPGGHRLLLLLGPPVPGSWLPEAWHPVEPAAQAEPGTDADVRRLAAAVPGLAAHEAYICGPTGWMRLAHRTLSEAGIPRAHIHDERFSW
ncbi:ferric reductase-like transmembrane domain-containing protein [Terrabacter sp. MAHUQ-38]|nr:ferric reductase-like transmembrane domain-containing protein [Terrabacter sp. MAHUQ-38]